MNNDRDFLRELFLKYGYDKSDVINKMMLDEIKVGNRIPEADETKALFASRGANGKLLIHRGLMEYMLKHVMRRMSISLCWISMRLPCWI